MANPVSVTVDHEDENTESSTHMAAVVVAKNGEPIRAMREVDGALVSRYR